LRFLCEPYADGTFLISADEHNHSVIARRRHFKHFYQDQDVESKSSAEHT